MRRRKSDVPAGINGNLRLHSGDVTLTRYPGLDLFGRYLRRICFSAMLRTPFVGVPALRDCGLVVIVRLLIGLVILGGRRLRHFACLCDHVVCRRFAGVRVVLSRRTVNPWLNGFAMRSVGRLQALNATVLTRVVRAGALRTLTIDVEGTIVSTGLQVDWAFRGFNPPERKVPSYYPILAHLAQTTHMLRLKNRSGRSTTARRCWGFSATSGRSSNR